MTVPAILLGRNAALAVVGAGLAVVLGLALWTFSAALVPGDETEALQHLAALQAEASALPQVERAVVALRGQAKAQPGLLQGDSDALALSALQGELKSMIEANGGEVRSSFALPPAPENGLAALSIQYDVTLPVTKLRGLLYAIESHLPYLFLSSVDIAAPQTWPSDPRAPEPRIEARWTVSAYRRSDPK
ncbi:MAG: type II secretion system protein GspM [Rhizomicrobium sp.]